MNLSRHQFLRLIAGAAAVPAGSRLAWGESASQLPFAQSSVLTGIYGTENKFQAVVAGELGSLDTTDKMVDFLKQKVIELGKDAGGKALKWASAELLNVFGLGGGSSELGEIKATLLKILETQQLILGKLEALLLEVQFQHLVTRGYESVERVTNAFQALQALSEISDVDERKREADRIKKGTLDLNQGTKFNLNTISDVMLGKDRLGQSQPMIDLFVERWLPVYRQKQCRDDVPLSTYHEQLDAWLHGLFMIQYIGIVELANARIANRDFESLKKEMTDTILRMEAQRALLAEAIPEWTRTLPASLFNNGWYVVQGLDPQNGRIDDSQVMYGSPASGNYLDYSVQFRDRHINNGDEEWAFEGTGQNDTFFMRERSRPAYVMDSGSKSIKVGGNRSKLRLVMTRTKNPAVNPAAKRRDLYVPAIILVGHSPDDAYLTWTRGGNNFVFKGDEGGAVQVAIVPPNTVRAAICRLPKGFQCVDRPRDPSYWTRCQNAVRFERQLGCLF